MTTTQHFLPDDAATARLGATLATTLAPGDLLLLVGDLGAGKTALGRAVIRTLLGEPALDVPSPSFALVQPYEGNGRIILHADLYRLVAEREIDELGLFDNPAAIVLIEWPERAARLFDEANLIVRLALPPGGHGRQVVIDDRTDRLPLDM